MTERVFGYPPGELLGLRIDVLVPGIAVDGSIAAGLERLAGSSDTFRGMRVSPEIIARRSDGTLFPAEIAVSRARNGRGEVFVICLRDISERHTTQEALRDSEARYRSLVDNAPEAITVIDPDTQRFIEANEPALRLFKMTRDQLLACNLGCGQRRDAARRPARESPHAPAPAARGGGRIAGIRVDASRLRPAATFPAKCGWCGCRAARKPLVRASITDISERKRAEIIMENERAFFALLASNAGLPAVLDVISALVQAVYPRCALHDLGARARCAAASR